jgi:hypothetical protein
MPLLIVFKA